MTFNLDTSIPPQDDFFAYVNNHWLQKNPIPDSETRWGTFNVLRENSWRAMRDIYEDTKDATPPKNSIEQQVRDFYFTGMHFNDLKETHLKEVRSFLQQIDAITNTKELSAIIGKLHSFHITGPWFCFVDSDHDDTSKHVLHFQQAGLTLPNRDYYLDKAAKMKAIRKAYEAHVKTVHTRFPELATTPQVLWDHLIDFEMAIAKISRSAADLRDVEGNFHKMSFKKVASTYANIDWEAYAKAFGWQADDKISIDQPEFMAFVSKSFTAQALSDWKIYLKWRVVSRFLGKISTTLADLHFEFYGQVLSGAKEIMPLWKRTVLTLETNIGEASGQLYAEKHFPESSKQQVLDIVEEVRQVYSQRIDTLDWMGDKTKAYAKEKLANIKVLIGYPDIWRDFSNLKVTRDSYIQNILQASAFDVKYWLKKLHQPTSRDDWFMTPQTVNAYHDPTRLVICFPAGILQAPFFDATASYASNMGGIGTVVGHELTHGFDDQGCMFDAQGNVRTWQTQKERDTFKKKAQIIIDQANEFEVLPGLTLRGGLVIGESIADLGGVELALHALKKQSPSKEDFRNFFTTYAFTECVNIRDEKLREFTLNDEHPAAQFRVNGILQHVDDFYKTFDVTNSAKLYRPPTERAKIW